MKLVFAYFVLSTTLGAGVVSSDVLKDDMILTPDQEKLYGGDADGAPFAGAGVKAGDIWPKGVIA